MAHRVLAQLKQQIQTTLLQHLSSLKQDVYQEISQLKQFVNHQTDKNQHSVQQQQRFESDLAILKLLLLEQRAHIDQLRTNLQRQPVSFQKVEEIQNQSPAQSAGYQKEPPSPKKSSRIVRQNSTKTQNQLKMSPSSNLLSARESFPVSLLSANLKLKKVEQLSPVDSVSSASPSIPPPQEIKVPTVVNKDTRDQLICVAQDLRNSKKLKQSQSYFLQANEVCLKLKEQEMSTQSEVLFWIASNHSGMGNYSEAIQYYREELSVREEIRESISENIAATFNNLGHNYYCQKDYRQALEYFEKAAEMQVRLRGNSNSTVGLYVKNLAEVFLQMENYRMAERYSQQSLEILQNLGETKSQICAWCHYFLAVIYFRVKRHSDCIRRIMDSIAAYRLSSKKEQFKEMLKAVARNSGNKTDFLRSAMAAVETLQDQWEDYIEEEEVYAEMI